MATLDDLEHLLTEVRICLAAITGRLDSALSTLEDHEVRVRGLERWRWMAAGIGAASGVLMGSVVALMQVMH